MIIIKKQYTPPEIRVREIVVPRILQVSAEGTDVPAEGPWDAKSTPMLDFDDSFLEENTFETEYNIDFK